jgi:hypothetical protein
VGYDRRAARQEFDLPFEDYPGLVVRVLAPSIGGELAAARVERVEQRGLPVAVWLAELTGLVAELADALVSWTLTERGRPVPPTGAELMRLDRPFLLDLLRGWALTVGATAAPEGVAPVEEQEPPEVTLGLADLAHLPMPGEPAWPVDESDGEPVLELAAVG